MPVRAAQLVQAHALIIAAADIFGDQIERSRRNIQPIRARKRNLDVIALGAVELHRRHAQEPADAVVFVYDKVARCQVGVRLDMVAVRPLRLVLFAPREDLSLGHHDQTEVGVLETGGQRALHDVDAAALGQQVAELHLQAAVGQRIQHIPAAQRTAADHRHGASLLDIAADVCSGHVEVAAVGVHLVGDKVLQMLRRELGHIVEKAVQT